MSHSPIEKLLSHSSEKNSYGSPSVIQKVPGNEKIMRVEDIKIFSQGVA